MRAPGSIAEYLVTQCDRIVWKTLICVLVDSSFVLIDRSRGIPLLCVEVAKLVKQSKLVREFGLPIQVAEDPFVLFDGLV